MIDEESCPGGNIECDYSEMHELTLVEKIMRAIEQYNRDAHADPCPACLRDAMLAVAALLHLRAARMETTAPLLATVKTMEAEFGEAACERLRAVTGVVAGGLTGLKQ